MTEAHIFFKSCNLPFSKKQNKLVCIVHNINDNMLSAQFFFLLKSVCEKNSHAMLAQGNFRILYTNTL